MSCTYKIDIPVILYFSYVFFKFLFSNDAWQYMRQNRFLEKITPILQLVQKSYLTKTRGNKLLLDGPHKLKRL